MKNYKPIVRIGQIFASGLLMLHASAVFAVAGDSIANKAVLSFNGGLLITSSPGGNSVVGDAGADTVFTEDRVINFAVLETTGASVTAAQNTSGNVLTFTVTNNGNGTQDFLLAAVNNVGGTDPFTASLDAFESTADVFVDQNGNGTYELLIDTGLFIQDLGPTQVETVFIVSTMPAVLADGVVSVVSLAAQVAATRTFGTDLETVATDKGLGINEDDNNRVSPAGSDYCNGNATCNVAAGAVSTVADDPAAEEIVFNDPINVGVDADSDGGVDLVRNGQASDSGSYTIASAVLTVTKTVGAAVFDTINGTSNAKAIPGATSYIPYTITISNAGPVSATLTSISDILGATLRVDPDFTSDNGTTFESAAGDTFEIDTGINAPATTTRTAALTYCTAAADADTCSALAALGSTITVSLNDAFSGMASEDVAPVGAGPEDYVAGELKAGDTITIRFQVIMQ